MKTVRHLLLAVSLATASIATLIAGAPSAAAEKTVKPKQPDQALLKTHIEQHIKYPATRAEILAACAQTKEFTAAEKAWIAAALPEGTYASADDVLKAIGKAGAP